MNILNDYKNHVRARESQETIGSNILFNRSLVHEHSKVNKDVISSGYAVVN